MLENQVRQSGYRFDVLQFRYLAQRLQDDLSSTAAPVRPLLGVNLTLKDGGQVEYLPEDRLVGGFMSPRMSATAKKGQQLAFFSEMIKAGVAGCKVDHEIWTGSHNAEYLGHAWNKATVLHFVNLLPCEQGLKIELAKFLLNPLQSQLSRPLDRYLTVQDNRVTSLPVDEADLVEADLPLVSAPAPEKSESAPVQKVSQPGFPDRISRFFDIFFGRTQTKTKTETVPSVQPRLVAPEKAATGATFAHIPVSDVRVAKIDMPGDGVGTRSVRRSEPALQQAPAVQLPAAASNTGNPSVAPKETGKVEGPALRHQPVALSGHAEKPNMERVLSSGKTHVDYDNPAHRVAYFPSKAKVPL